jgi:hypothetical protein
MLRVQTVFAGIALLSLVLMAGCEKKPGLRITGIEPKKGSANGGDLVTIKGSGFGEGGAMAVEVWFGGKKGRGVNIVGDNQIKVVTPAHEADKTVDVVLQFDDARSYTYKKAFLYLEPAGIKVDDLIKKKE